MKWKKCGCSSSRRNWGFKTVSTCTSISFLLKPLLLILNYNMDLLIKADLIDCLIINNYQLLLISGNVGAGEREGRVISSLVSRRHFR